MSGATSAFLLNRSCSLAALSTPVAGEYVNSRGVGLWCGFAVEPDLPASVANLWADLFHLISRDLNNRARTWEKAEKTATNLEIEITIGWLPRTLSLISYW